MNLKNEEQNLKANQNCLKQTKGITLIALVITIIVLLILARSNNCNINRRKWNTNQSTKCKNTKR